MTVVKNDLKEIGMMIRNNLNVYHQTSDSLEKAISGFTKVLNVIDMDSTETDEVTEVKRGRGRPRKDSTNVQEAVIGVVKRGRGRPKKEDTTEEPKSEVVTTEKRGPGRPKKTEEVAVAQNDSTDNVKRGRGRPRKITETIVAVIKRGPGRPKKNVEDAPAASTTNVASSGGTSTGGRGRPSLEDILAEPLTPELKAEISRIEENISTFNQWKKTSHKENEIWVIENATYMGIIEGFPSTGSSGKYGIKTRVFINPNSNLVPDDLKKHVNTTAVNRIRYVDSKEDGLEYIAKQKEKIADDMFTEIMPKIIKDHGKKDSVYAFHLNTEIRRGFNRLKAIYDNKYAAKLEKQLVRS